MKNNMSPPPSTLQRSNIIYEFECPLSHGIVTPKYVGFTQTSLSRRLTMHLQNGSIRNHFQDQHDTTLTREIIVNNTKIIEKAKDRYHLAIKEALLIMNTNPIINRQENNFSNILRLNTHRINASVGTTSSDPISRVVTPPNQIAQPQSIVATPLHDEETLNISANHSTVSPNIQQRISSLLQSSRQNTQNDVTQTPYIRRLRSRRQI